MIARHSSSPQSIRPRRPVRAGRPPRFAHSICVALLACATGCATVTPEYSLRPTPQPEDSAASVQIERTISAQQAQDLEKQGVRRLQRGEQVFGFDVQKVVDKLSRVTERPNLDYRVFLLQDKEPNAVSLADGRVYITTGMLQYLASRGSNESELGFVLGHELAHTVAQHLVKRYYELQKQQAILSVVGAGAEIVTQGRGPRIAQLGGLAKTAASLVSQVAVSGYSQDQELEADQLGLRYMMKAGYDPKAALAMVEDFQRFDQGGSFLRTHPYTQRRYEDLQRYLVETGVLSAPAASASPAASQSFGASGAASIGASPNIGNAPRLLGPGTPVGPGMIPAGGALAPARSSATAERRKRLIEAQKLYPQGSQSWTNLQRQIEQLD